MQITPVSPKIYHITHVDNLSAILAQGGLVSDAAMVARGGPAKTIGMSSIKTRRLALPVDCHPGDKVGDYVPFYFCPRSVMLYLIYRGNHPELGYRGGQDPIVHLEADLQGTVQWAMTAGKRWAFSLSNAGAYYTQFRKDLAHLGEVNWPAVESTNFRPADVKEGKQAEFLIHDSFPWSLVSRIGVASKGIANKVDVALDATKHRPGIEVRLDWYY